MRTPGNDYELAAGFLVTEGLIGDGADIARISYCPGPDQQQFNVLDVTLAPGVAVPPATAARPFVTTSSCGLCGKAGIEMVRTKSRYDVAADPMTLAAAVIGELPARLRRLRRCSRGPAACMPPGSSTPPGDWSACGRTSAATTPSTRSSAGPRSAVGCPW